MELIKRVEMITGPGGVLWGSNSLLGILNVITKDAEDVDGVEVGTAVGDGAGDRMMGRAYAMVGAPDLMHGKLKVFAHGSVETYQGPELEMPLLDRMREAEPERVQGLARERSNLGACRARARDQTPGARAVGGA